MRTHRVMYILTVIHRSNTSRLWNRFCSRPHGGPWLLERKLFDIGDPSSAPLSWRRSTEIFLCKLITHLRCPLSSGILLSFDPSLTHAKQHLPLVSAQSLQPLDTRWPLLGRVWRLPFIGVKNFCSLGNGFVLLFSCLSLRVLVVLRPYVVTYADWLVPW